MKRWMFGVLIMAVGAAMIGCAQNKLAEHEQNSVGKTGSDVPRGKVTRYGLFQERSRGWVKNDASSSTGKVIRGATLEFIEGDTQNIVLRKGTTFGYRYWLKISPDKNRPKFRRVLIHPLMILPDGSRVTRSERMITKRATHGIVTAIDAYALSEDYELVEGEWLFQLWYKGHKLTEQKFITHWPEKSASAGT